MKYKTIILKKDGNIATIVLNRPERLNALIVRSFQELASAIKEIDEDDDIKVLVVTGAGRGFCSGADVENHPAFKMEDRIKRREIHLLAHEVIRGLRNMGKPVIASVNGDAVAAGFDLALACDIRIASRKARFGETFIKISLIPDSGGNYFLPLLVGVGKACELVFTGDIIGAEEAERIGLVNKVVPPDDLEAETKAFAIKLAKNSSMALKFAKRAIYGGLNRNLDAALEHESFAVQHLLESEDVKKAVRAFLGKKKLK